MTRPPTRRLGVNNPDDPTTVVLRYIDAFDNANPNAMAALCADPMQILDRMPPHVWLGPTARAVARAANRRWASCAGRESCVAAMSTVAVSRAKKFGFASMVARS
jgi:hypothetical protein